MLENTRFYLHFRRLPRAHFLRGAHCFCATLFKVLSSEFVVSQDILISTIKIFVQVQSLNVVCFKNTVYLLVASCCFQNAVISVVRNKNITSKNLLTLELNKRQIVPYVNYDTKNNDTSKKTG